MLGLSKVNLLLVSGLVSSALAATITTGGKSIEISSRRVTRAGGVFAGGETVTTRGVGTGGMIVCASDGELISDIKEGWARAAGSSSGIYYELQEVDFTIYPGQSLPWSADGLFCIYLPPLSEL